MNNEYYVGLDIGGTSAKIGLVQLDGKISEKTSIATLKNTNWENVLNEFIKPIKKWVDKQYNIKGIGICFPGFFNKIDGLIYNCENVQSLLGAPIVNYITDKFNIPTIADNDATAAAIGEFLFGAGKNFKDFLMVTLGTGIGGGLILNNKVYRGHNGFAGELGHMIIVAEGRDCACGNKGCIERYSSASAIIQFIKDGIKKGFITSYKKDEPINAQIIFQKAQEGDPHSLQAIDIAARYLGRMLGSIVNLLNIEAIIIGGGIAASGDIFIKKIKYYIDQISWNLFTKDLKVLPAELLNDAGIIGAASLIIEEIKETKNKNCNN